MDDQEVPSKNPKTFRTVAEAEAHYKRLLVAEHQNYDNLQDRLITTMEDLVHVRRRHQETLVKLIQAKNDHTRSLETHRAALLKYGEMMKQAMEIAQLAAESARSSRENQQPEANESDLAAQEPSS
ncbi:hypothetical protein L596_000111 [Steinernema carpocapsae]|uniref:Uncharacterized protein n=1 Tax=Steinernema carpocapsae TaxID=34508 RepID=A0A4U8UH87_STECR|nr:hypothetical protein L596_000111 [Steinernema carpocapsae]